MNVQFSQPNVHFNSWKVTERQNYAITYRPFKYLNDRASSLDSRFKHCLINFKVILNYINVLKSKTINCNNLNETNIYTCVYKSEEKFKKKNTCSSRRRTADLVRSLIIFNNKNTLLNLSVGSVAHFPLGTQIAVISSLGHVAFCLRCSG